MVCNSYLDPPLGTCDLVVDAGNTQVKLALFEGKRLLWRQLLRTQDVDQIAPVPFGRSIRRVMISDVSLFRSEHAHVLAPMAHVSWLTSDTKLPFCNRYASPASLGADRLAAVAGAYYELGGGSCIVVDVGTAVTCEVLHCGLGYLGGSISPGIRLRLDALHQYTARLPHVQWRHAAVPSIGNDTLSCMLVGCVLGIVGEIDNFAHRIRHLYRAEDFQLVLTGGDAGAVSGELGTPHLVCPDLVLYGLHGLLDTQ